MKKWVLVVIGGALVIWAAAYAMLGKKSDGLISKLNAHVLVIPSHYSLEGEVPGWLRRLPGLDSSNKEILLGFDADELAAQIAGYKPWDGKYKENIAVDLAALNSVEIDRVSHPEELKDIWYGTGSYKDRTVEPYQDHPWYKVFRKVEYPNSWAVVTQYPDTAKPLPSDAAGVLLAECLTLHSPLVTSGKRIDCVSNRLMGDMNMEFHISEQNLPVVDAVKDYLQTKILSWEIANR